MASIDPYLKLAIDKNARQFVLAPGQKPVLVFESGKTTLGKEITAKQIQRGVMEIVPSDKRGDFTATGELKWSYSLAGHCFQISSRSLPTGLEVIFVNEGKKDESADADMSLSVADLSPQKQAPAGSVPEPRNNQTGTMSIVGSMDGEGEIDQYLIKMMNIDASDLHLCSGSKPMYRVDGDLNSDSMGRDLDPQYLVDTLFEIAPPDMFDDFQDKGSCDFAYELGELARFRVNVYKEHCGISAAIRIIPQKVRTAEQLGLPPVVRMLATLPKGLVLVTGPTGSGKSTTLAALVDLVNRTRRDHIITIEQPIEFVHKSKKCLVHQREVGTHTPNFTEALKDALREDPDVVLIGEMRDLETISTAIETAATGHLVFGTLHTTTAIGTVERIIDMFPADQQAQIRMMLSDSLKAVIAQNLLKKNGGGRVAAQEILVVTPSVSNMIREKKTHQILNIMQTGRAMGMQMLGDELLKLVKAGTVSPMEAYSKAVDKTDIMRLYETHGVKFKAPADLDTLEEGMQQK